jgi:hypothetical protein
MLRYLMQQATASNALAELVELICSYLHGRGGNAPGKTDMGDAKAEALSRDGTPRTLPGSSRLQTPSLERQTLCGGRS